MTAVIADQHIGYLVSNLMRVHNRVQRYERRLLKEAILTAKKKEIPLAFSRLRVVRSDDPTHYVHVFADESIDMSLLDIVKEDFPSLYRKYHRAREHYKTLSALTR